MRRFQEAAHTSIVNAAFNVNIRRDEVQGDDAIENERFLVAGMSQWILRVHGEDVSAYLFPQSAPASTPKPSNPRRNVAKAEKPPELRVAVETLTKNLLDGKTSASVGVHSVRRR